MYDPSKDFDNLDFSCFDEPTVSARDYKYCETCNILCKEVNCELICPNCGEERPWNYDFDFFSKNMEQNHNTSANQYMGIMVTGKNSKGIRNCLKMCGADYYKQGEIAVRETLEKKIQDSAIEVHSEIIDKTLEIYSAIKKTDIVFRSQGKWYVIGACMNYSFLEAGIPKTRKEICSVIGITEKKLSTGENQLEKLNDMGVIHLTFNPAAQKVFVENYLRKLKIPLHYSDFISDIMSLAEKQYLHIKNESRPASRCIGTIYMLCQCEKELNNISKEIISEKCKISKTTFLRYYKLLEINILLLASAFITHKIPMRASWRVYLKMPISKNNPELLPMEQVLGFKK